MPTWKSGRRSGTVTGFLVAANFMLGLTLGFSEQAHASVALLMEQPYGTLAKVNPTGHSALYLDHVCAATPLRLRPCRPGELGVVLSRYDGITQHDWVAIPLIPYLYAVEDAQDIPVTVNREEVSSLRDRYRRTHLESVAPDLPDGSAPEGNWYELAGSAFDRTIYGFELKSTPEQDAELIAHFNDQANSEVYNAIVRNCADFARSTINRFYYPHAIRRNFIADFGMTTPKSVARSLSHYAKKHPEADLKMFVVSQLSGDLPRSHSITTITEGLIKRYGLPMMVVSPVTTAAVLAAYVGHGRFAEPKEAPILNLRPGLAMEDAITRTPGLIELPGTLVAEAPPSAAAPATFLGGGSSAPGAESLTKPSVPSQAALSHSALPAGVNVVLTGAVVAGVPHAGAANGTIQ